MFRRIGIVSKPHEPAVKDALASVLRVLEERRCDIVIDAGADNVEITGNFIGHLLTTGASASPSPTTWSRSSSSTPPCAST